MKKETTQKSKSFYENNSWYHRTKVLQDDVTVKYGKKDDFAPKTYTKQEVRLKTESSYRTLPIPDYVFEAILEERKIYERNRSRRGSQFLDMACFLRAEGKRRWFLI